MAPLPNRNWVSAPVLMLIAVGFNVANAVVESSENTLNSTEPDAPKVTAISYRYHRFRLAVHVVKYCTPALSAKPN